MEILEWYDAKLELGSESGLVSVTLEYEARWVPVPCYHDEQPENEVEVSCNVVLHLFVGATRVERHPFIASGELISRLQDEFFDDTKDKL